MPPVAGRLVESWLLGRILTLRAGTGIPPHRRNHFVDPHSVIGYHFEFRTQFGLGHAARSDDLQILLVAVEVRSDFQSDAIRIEKIEGMNRRGDHQEWTRIYTDPIGFESLQSTGGPGDKIHPNRVGYLAMGSAIDLNLLAPIPVTRR